MVTATASSSCSLKTFITTVSSYKADRPMAVSNGHWPAEENSQKRGCCQCLHRLSCSIKRATTAGRSIDRLIMYLLYVLTRTATVEGQVEWNGKRTDACYFCDANLFAYFPVNPFDCYQRRRQNVNWTDQKRLRKRAKCLVTDWWKE